MPKTRLNDLEGKEWLKSTKSVWSDQETITHLRKAKVNKKSEAMLSVAPQRDSLKIQHPATFSEKDIAKLILFFTKNGEVVCDPFLGSGSAVIAALEENRKFIGFEVYEKWYKLTKERLKQFDKKVLDNSQIKKTDAKKGLSKLVDESIDFIVTSPPYWGILDKKDHKAKKERVSKKLVTDYGQHNDDLSQIPDYDEFIQALKRHFCEYYRVLKYKKYAAIIVSDFRHKQKYYMFHSDINKILEEVGFTSQGLINLIQDNKKLYPYGYPTTFVPNISNQFIVIARKL